MLRVRSSHWNYKFSAIQKQASVTFTVKDSDRISKPKQLKNICWDIQHQIGDTYPRKWILNGSLDNTITPDAPQWDEMTGKINWYVPSVVPPQDVYPYVSDVIKDMELIGITIHANPIQQKSRMMDPDAYKIVLDVVNNETMNFEDLPEINISQGNAAVIMELLGLSESEKQDSPFGALIYPLEANGQIAAQELLRRIKQAYGKIQSSVRPPSEGFSGEEENPYTIETPYSQLEKERDSLNKGRWFDQGMDKEKIWRSLNNLESLALKAIRLQLNKNQPAMIIWH